MPAQARRLLQAEPARWHCHFSLLYNHTDKPFRTIMRVPQKQPAPRKAAMQKHFQKALDSVQP
ncbi:MAG: rRNA (cytidine-2'-O-)-methyltransferase, partial [Kingella sp. (in: b-proteobacteria)]